jgi:hypothetical protein
MVETYLYDPKSVLSSWKHPVNSTGTPARAGMEFFGQISRISLSVNFLSVLQAPKFSLGEQAPWK